MASPDDLRALGYEVGEAAPGVFAVRGFGAAIYVASDDQATIDSLADPALHAERIASLDSVPQPSAAKAPPLAKNATLADVIAKLNELTG